MKNTKCLSTFFLSIITLFVLTGSVNAQKTNSSTANKVKNLLTQMTLEEKVGQMTQVDFAVVGFPEGSHASNLIFQRRL